MLSVLTLASRLLGLLREMTKARFLGTSALSDAFTVAFVIPNLLRRLFAENSISVAFIPTFRNFLAENNKEETRAFLSSCFTFISFAVTSVVVLGILITPWIVPFFGTAEAETVFLTRIMFPYLAVISVAAFFQGILNGVKIFLPSGFTPVLFNLCVIGFTWLFRDAAGNPARAMAFGVTAGGCLQAAFQLPFVLRTGFRFSFTPLRRAFSNPGTRTVLRLVGPTVFGMAAYQLNDLVSTILAGNAGEGVVSSLQYSLRLQELILGIFAVTIGTVILPDLSGLADAGRKAYDSIWRSKTAPRGYCFVRKTLGFSDFDALLIEKNKPKMKMADLYTGLFLLGKLMGDIYSPKRVFSIENSAARSVYFFDAKEVLK